MFEDGSEVSLHITRAHTSLPVLIAGVAAAPLPDVLTYALDACSRTHAAPPGPQVDMTWSGHVHVYGAPGWLPQIAHMHCHILTELTTDLLSDDAALSIVVISPERKLYSPTCTQSAHVPSTRRRAWATPQTAPPTLPCIPASAMAAMR